MNSTTAPNPAAETKAAAMKQDFENARDGYVHQVEDGASGTPPGTPNMALKPSGVRTKDANAAAGLSNSLSADFEQARDAERPLGQDQENSLLAPEESQELSLNQELDYGLGL